VPSHGRKKQHWGDLVWCGDGFSGEWNKWNILRHNIVMLQDISTSLFWLEMLLAC